MDAVSSNNQHPTLEKIRDDLQGSLTLKKEDPLGEIADLVSSVAIRRIEGKKKRNSYELRFKVALRRPNDNKAAEIRWITLTTHKADLKASIRTMQAIRGLAVHMTPTQFETTFVKGGSRGVKVFELTDQSSLQKGGTRLYGVKIKDEHLGVWRTFERTSWLGLVPDLPPIGPDQKVSAPVPPKKTFVALNLSAAVDDTSGSMPPGASSWDRARNFIRTATWSKVLGKAAAGMPMIDKMWPGVPDNYERRIDKLFSVHRKEVKVQGKDKNKVTRYQQQHEAYRNAEKAKQREKRNSTYQLPLNNEVFVDSDGREATVYGSRHYFGYESAQPAEAQPAVANPAAAPVRPVGNATDQETIEDQELTQLLTELGQGATNPNVAAGTGYSDSDVISAEDGGNDSENTSQSHS
jgi:hypothetical protein